MNSGNEPSFRINILPGTYDVTVTDAEGCARFLQDLIVYNDCPDDNCELLVEATAVNATCAHEGSISLIVTNGLLPLHFDWADLNASPEPENRGGLGQGLYTVVVTDGTGCVVILDNILVEDDCSDVPTCTMSLQATAADQTCAQGGSINLAVSGGQAPYVFNWTDVFSMPEPQHRTGLNSGAYSVLVTDAAGCQEILGNILIANNCVNDTCDLAVNAAITPATCLNDGGINLNVTGGTQPYAFDWTGISGNNEPEDRSNLASGIYEVFVSDAGGCEVLLQNIIVGNNCPSDSCDLQLSAAAENVTCTSQGSIDLSVSGGQAPYHINWTHLNGSNEPEDLANLPEGIYEVVVTDQNSCITNLDGIVVTNECTTPSCDLVVTVSTTMATCTAGGSVTLDLSNGTGPYTFTWSDLSGNGQPQNRNNLAVGIYGVIVTEAGGCQVVTQGIIIGYECATDTCAMLADYTVGNAGCATGGSIDLVIAGGNAPYGYDWADLPGTADPMNRSGLLPGIYSVLIEDAGGCSFVLDNLTVGIDCDTDSCDMTITATPSNITCDQGGSISLTISGGVPPLHFDWSDMNGDNQPQDRTDLAEGPYSVLVTDATGCVSVIGSISIEDNCNPSGCDVENAFIATNDPTVICTDDAMMAVLHVNVTLSDGFADNLLYLVTDLDSNILMISPLPDIDIETITNTNTDTMNILWALTYTGSLSGAITGQPVSAIQGCYELSNPIIITETSCTMPAPSPDTIYMEVTESTTEVECVELEEGFEPGFTVFSLSTGGTGTNSAYGHLEVDQDGCLNYTAGSQTGYNVDSIVVIATNDIGVTDTTLFLITIRNEFCLDSTEYVTLSVPDCDSFALLCLPVTQDDLDKLDIILDGMEYAGNIEGCEFDSIIAYTYYTLLGAGTLGPYYLESWTVNDSTFSGEFQDIEGLVDLMNASDPGGNWTQEPDNLIITGGDNSNSYSTMLVNQLLFPGSYAVIGFNIGVTSTKSSILVPAGDHVVLIVDPLEGCIDTTFVTVTCDSLTIPVTNIDTLFLTTVEETSVSECLDISDLTGDISSTAICNAPDNGSLTIDNNCLIYTPFAGFVNENDTICLILCDIHNFCDTTIVIISVTPSAPPVSDIDTVYLTTMEIMPVSGCGAPDSLVSATWTLCSIPANGGIVISQTGPCITYTPNTGFTGTDQICLTICDATGLCDTTLFIITVNPVVLTPDTINLITYTNTPVITCLSTAELPGTVVSVNSCNAPVNGTMTPFANNDITCVMFTPAQDFAGQEELCVFLCDNNGFCDITHIFVTVLDTTTNPVLPVTDTLYLNTTPTTAVIGCVNADELTGFIDNFAICGLPANGQLFLDQIGLCAGYLPDPGFEDASDTMCIILCDENGICDTTIIVVYVAPAPVDTDIDTVYVTTSAGIPVQVAPLMTTWRAYLLP